MRSPHPLRRRRRRVPRARTSPARRAARPRPVVRRGRIQQRLIDIPLESLPHIDAHSVYVAAPGDRVWEALLTTMARPGHAHLGDRLARTLGCTVTERKGKPGAIGSTIPGFMVTRSVKPAVLALMGEHRYSRYALIFYATDTAAGPVRLSAETRAQFPGFRGQVYKTIVIRSGGHAIVTRRILRSVRRRAERG